MYIYVCMHIFMYVHAHSHKHTRSRTNTHRTRTRTRTHTHTYSLSHTYQYVYMIYAHTHVCVYTEICSHVQFLIQIHVQMHTYTYIHTHIHIQRHIYTCGMCVHKYVDVYIYMSELLILLAMFDVVSANKYYAQGITTDRNSRCVLRLGCGLGTVIFVNRLLISKLLMSIKTDGCGPFPHCFSSPFQPMCSQYSQ